MKVTIDLDRLLEEGKINQAEYDKFSQFSARTTAALAFNLLIGFGVIAVSGGAIALLPAPATAIAIGLAIGAIGGALTKAHSEQWRLLASICIIVGALLFGGGVIAEGKGSIGSFLMVALAFAGAGVLARSSLLIVLAVLALSSCIGARTGYFHAMYFLGIQEPALTVALFCIFSVAATQLSKRLAADYQGLATAAARTGVFLVNFGFWVGSLWGDGKAGSPIFIADWVFAVLWAIALMAAGAWAWHRNLRWLVNVAAVFAAIHFYTQWFERLDASALSVLIAGLLALGFAVGLRALNLNFGKEA
jgi:hypothetical protein